MGDYANTLLAARMAVCAEFKTLMHRLKPVVYTTQWKINAFIDRHIEEMKKSENATISRTGKVIEGAKYGFGIGYVVPIAIIAAGQFLLGNTLTAVLTLATAATLTNPVAMTCAAVGAIYYGWGALSDLERQEILEKLSHGLEIGVELIKSVIGFVINKTKEFLSSENILELKRYVGSAAAAFGRTLSDVTGSIADKIKGACGVVVKTLSAALGKTKKRSADTYTVATGKAQKVVGAVKGKFNKPDQK